MVINLQDQHHLCKYSVFMWRTSVKDCLPSIVVAILGITEYIRYI